MLNRHRTYQRQSMGLVFFAFFLVLSLMYVRLGYLMFFRADYYGIQAKELHERERRIKAERGKILTARTDAVSQALLTSSEKNRELNANISAAINIIVKKYTGSLIIAVFTFLLAN